MGGTVLDSFGIFGEVLAKILPEFKLQLPDEETLFHNFHGSLEDSLRQVIGTESAVKLSDVIERFLSVQNSHYEVIEPHILSDAKRVIEQAHHARIEQLIVTNREHEGRLNASPRYIVEHSSLKGKINKVVCGDDTRYRKPDTRVLDDFSYDPDCTIVIGDQFVDGQFGLNLGVRTILVNRQSAKLAHLEMLGKPLPKRIQIVSTLDNIKLESLA